MRVLYFFWSLPINILKSGYNMVPRLGDQSTPRRRPLHTFGASFLAIAHNASTKLQDYDSTIGSIAKKGIELFNLFFPFVYTMLYQWLAMLSFMDDQILTVENTVENIFPPSKRLFDKIDTLVRNAEVLPEQVDGLMTKIPMIMDWPIFHKFSWLNSILFNVNSREKEIKIDENSNSTHCTKSEPEGIMKSQSDSSLQENDNARESIKRVFSLRKRVNLDEQDYGTSDSPGFASFKSAASSPFSDCSYDESKSPFGQMDSSPTRQTYKEILERGKKADDEDKDDNAPSMDKEEKAEKSGKYSEDGRISKAQVEELFAGCLM